MLRRAIHSVLDQTYPHFQICIYDNASNDDTAEVVDALTRLDSRIRYYCHPENIGPQDNFIFGLSRVDTPFFNLLSDDDFLLPEFFAHATSALQRNEHSSFFLGGVLSADPEGRVIGFPRFGHEREQTCSPPRLFHLLAPNTRTWTSIVFRRTLLETLDGLRRETSYAVDTDFILRSAVRFQAVLSDTPYAVFTLHPASSSIAQSPEAFESQLNLALFNSVNQAIDSAQDDKLLTLSDAAEMKATFRILTEHSFFRNAFGLIARGRLSVALHTSEILAEIFERKGMAAAINLAIMDNSIGALVRLGIRSIRAARKVWFARNSSALYSGESELVKNRIVQLTERGSGDAYRQDTGDTGIVGSKENTVEAAS
jgi:glycosyltransferase involved in cell wall biosynthesis